MLVRIEVTGNIFGACGLFKAVGQKIWVEESVALDAEKKNVAKIIERPEQASVPARKLSKR